MKIFLWELYHREISSEINIFEWIINKIPIDDFCIRFFVSAQAHLFCVMQ